MRTLGIDLASQPRNTAAAVIDWSSDPPRVVPLHDLLGKAPRLNDSALVKLITRKDIGQVAIDAPFGWPAEFVDAVVQWRDHQTWPVSIYDSEADPAKQTQAKLTLRATDRAVHRATALPLGPDQGSRRGKWPLSVTTDKIAFAAMRCVRILAEVGSRQGSPVDRSGAGRIAEVYPDAALREWGTWPSEWQDHRPPLGYKGKTDEHRDRRRQLLQLLADRAGSWLVADSKVVESCVASDDDLDALICGLLARVVEQGHSQPVACSERADQEGWIHLPLPGSLGSLFG